MSNVMINPVSKGWNKRFQGLEKRVLRVPTLGKLISGALLAGSLTAMAQEAAPVAIVKRPAEKLIEQAQAEQAAGNPKQAIQTAAQVLVLGPVEKETLAKCELLIAGLYLDQGMTNAAGVTARQIQVLYSGTDFEKDAEVLRAKIKQLKEEAK
jgi:hypothetical protein